MTEVTNVDTQPFPFVYIWVNSWFPAGYPLATKSVVPSPLVVSVVFVGETRSLKTQTEEPLLGETSKFSDCALLSQKELGIKFTEISF